jgi:hypothetical protein
MPSANYPQSHPPFGPRALVEGRGRAAYDSPSLKVLPALRPTGVFAGTWVGDFVDLSWDVFRPRPVKIGPIGSHQRRSLSEALLLHVKQPRAKILSKRYFSGNPASAVVKPKDFLEEIFTRDVVDLTWETLRMRRLEAALGSHRDFRKRCQCIVPTGGRTSPVPFATGVSYIRGGVDACPRQ